MKMTTVSASAWEPANSGVGSPVVMFPSLKFADSKVSAIGMSAVVWNPACKTVWKLSLLPALPRESWTSSTSENLFSDFK